MKTLFNRYLLAFAFGIGFFSCQSCKERTVTKTDMIPAVDNIHTFRLSSDSLDISMQTAVLDSVRTNLYSSTSSPVVALGLISADPFFGKLTAGLYLQVVPPVASFSFPSSATYTFDSAVLALPYAGVSFGDTTNPAANVQSFEVYRVNSPMNIEDSNVYTFTDYSYDPTAIGGGSYSLQNIKDTFVVSGDTLSNQLRIKLDRDYIYSNIVQADTSKFSTNEHFTDYFNGWYIKPSGPANGKRVSYFALIGGNTLSSARVDFYFHDATNKVTVYSFPFNYVTTAYANRIQRDYTGAPAHNYLNTQVRRDSLIAEGTPGLYTKITLRNLNKIPASIINQAELVLTAVPVGLDQYFAPPVHLLIEKVDESGVVSPIADVYGSSGSPTTGGLNFMDGNPETVTINGQAYTQYKLNFPRELQKAIMEGRDSLTFRITANSGYNGAYRMVAPGFGSSADGRMKLNIIYTKIK
ncbi:MAG TPA: DUF4270 family protein [Edaphocola sp.]|nr:DUF4270 family protein [Edaphocola sp.]